MTTTTIPDVTTSAWKQAVVNDETEESYDVWRRRTLDAAHPDVPALEPVAGTPLTITFENDAWEFFYEFLGEIVTKRQLCVDLNGVTVELGQLIGAGTKPYLNPGTILRYTPHLADGQPGTTRQVPLFTEGGGVALHSIHVH